MKLPSRVKEFIRLNSRHITTLPQVSFDFWIAKQQSSKLNISEFSLNNLQQFKKEGTAVKFLHRENFLFISVLGLWLIISKHEHVFAN